LRRLRILFLEPQPCIRALKYANALRFSLGERVSLCFGYTGYSLNSLYGYGDECFERLVKLDINELDQGIRALINDFDPTLIHSHNAPNTLTLSAVSVAEDVPIIHDVHEVLSVHNSGFEVNDDDESLSKYCEEERRANEESDGRIYATEDIGEYIQQHYDVNAENDLVFHNYVSESVIPRHFEERLSKRDGDMHIVYIGCVTSVVEDSHYDLRKIFKDIASHGMHIHIYPTSNLITLSNDSYKRLADSSEFIHFHGNMNRKELLKEITQYDFGWAGFNGAANNEHLELAFPNKIIEYVACGLPVLAFPHKTIQRFIEQYGVGLVFDDIDDLEELLKSGSPSNIRETVLNSRHCFAIENQISSVVDFYEQIIG
jgi:glycosyltransferase involved in cell wall biosynthesis